MCSDRVTIMFKGKPLACRKGTSIAVALWEKGIRHLSHSHKYGKPRGLTCARGHCTACLMRVNGEPNVRTCLTQVQDGMTVNIQDSGAFYGPPMQKVLEIGGGLFPVGFYYKWFTRPPFLSRMFLNQIRPLTGVGRLPEPSNAVAALPPGQESKPVLTNNRGNLGRLVIGAGPSGLALALEAATEEKPITLIDDHELPGGQRGAALEFLAGLSGPGIERFGILTAAHKRLQRLKEEMSVHPHIHFLGETRALAGYQPADLLLRNKAYLQTASFDHLTWATGALDTLGLFSGNDTPGVIGPRATYRLLLRDKMVVSGARVLVIGGGLDFWLTAALLNEKGATVSLVLTQSGWQSEVSAAVDRRWQLTTGLHLSNICGQGQNAIDATFVPGASTPGPAHSQLNLKADFAVICGRGKPSYDVPYQLGVDLAARKEWGGYAPRETQSGHFAGVLKGGQKIWVVGEAAGALPADQVLNPGKGVTP